MAPIIVKAKVMPRRPRNATVRPREYLTPSEAERLIAWATNRSGARYSYGPTRSKATS